MIIGRNPTEANASTGEIQLLGNPVAYKGNILKIPLASMGKLGAFHKLRLHFLEFFDHLRP